MQQQVQPGAQLPVDGTGKVMADFPVEVATPTGPQTVHVPATVLVDASGYEIGSKLVRAMNDLAKAIREAV